MKIIEVNNTDIHNGLLFKTEHIDFSFIGDDATRITVPPWCANKILVHDKRNCHDQGKWEILPANKEPILVHNQICKLCGIKLPSWKQSKGGDWIRVHPEYGFTEKNTSRVKNGLLSWAVIPNNYEHDKMIIDISKNPIPRIELIPDNMKSDNILVLWKIEGTKIRYNAKGSLILSFAHQYIHKDKIHFALLASLAKNQSIYVIRGDKKPDQIGFKYHLDWDGSNIKVDEGDKTLFKDRPMSNAMNHDQVKNYLKEMANDTKH